MADDPYRYFRLEAREIVDQFGAAVLGLEKDGDVGQVQHLLRLAHTLKGAARVVKQTAIADAAHAIEELLGPFRAAAAAVPRDELDGLLRQLDIITGHVRVLEMDGQPAARVSRDAPIPSPEAAGDNAIRSVRADIAEIDALLDGIAETHALLNRLRTTQHAIEQARTIAELIATQLARLGGAVGAKTYQLAEDLRRGVGEAERRLGATVEQMHRELRQLHDDAEQVRLVGAATLFPALERTVRDSAQALAKEVEFVASGGAIRLEADLMTTAQRALVQIVRNAVAHGIEHPAIRRAKGKPTVGRIVLDVSRRGDRIVFTCRDDGAGVNLEAVRHAAVHRGAGADITARRGAQELMNLLMQGGISTAEGVSEVAGRGIGLDVVRAAAARLGGTVGITTEADHGTTFELTVPLALASIEVLIVAAAGTMAAIPLDAVRGTLLLQADAVSRDASGPTVIYEKAALPFLWLSRALAGERLPPDRRWPGIVITGPGGTAAVGVDRLFGTARLVARPLPALAPAAAIVAGAALDAEGNPQLVLSAEALIAAAQQQDAVAADPAPPRHPILIVDDSLTTRMLEQSILESAGYEVDLATSAEEALEIAQRRRYALFLVDVEMPGMDGFTFIEKTRGHPLLRDVPAVLVTSRAAPDDRRRGQEVGACGYIVKGEFDQAELLATIRSQVAQ
ncbi:MAG TPA: response regulator [Stellaceae bacterium]|nr:response regulator [Stellaceae bacterium]